MNLYQQSYQALMQTDTRVKREQIKELLTAWKNSDLNRDESELVKIIGDANPAPDNRPLDC